MWIKQVDSDCVNEGTLGHYSCSGCSKSFDVDKKEITDLSIDALGHDTENHEAKDPTCTEDGWYAYETCKREGCTYSTKVVRTSPGHNYGDWIAEVPATCVDNGTKGHYKCSVCKLNFDVDKNAITDITLYAEGHKGGTATCDQQAICDNCGTKYGSFDPDNHSGKKVWAQTSTTHTQKWDCCDDVTVNATEHVWENGICSDCEYKCVHTGGTANCHELAKCEICGNSYGYFIQDAHTGFKAWFCSESTHRRVWSCCNASIVAEEEHEWENGECNECGYDCSHTWTDSVCDKCGLECVDHTGGTATCIKLAVCSTCGAEYGTTDTSKHVGKIVWTREAHTHKSSWDCCGLPVVTEESHEWSKGSCTECDYKCAHSGWTDDVCDDCGYTCPHKHWTNGVCDLCSHVCVHTGGTATCSYKATCNVCGSKYGVLDPENHSDLVFVPAAPSTASQEGNRDHYYCSGCGKYYDCTEEKEEIEHIEVVIEKLPPEIVIGNDQSRPLNSGDGLSVMSNALREDFVIVLVNGTELDSSDYTISEDNLEIVLNAEYLNTLKRGKHRLVIRSASGDAVTTFTITRARIPVWGWVAIGIASIAILSSIIVSILKRTGVIIPY